MSTTKHPPRSNRAGGRPGLVLLLCWLCALCAMRADRAGAGELDLGPLFFYGADLATNALTTAVGPVFESRHSASGMVVRSVRPFYSLVDDEPRDRRLQEYLWPAGMFKDFEGHRFWRFLLAYGDDFDNTQPDSRYRFVVFPVLFTGRDKNAEKYFAVFPLGGTIHEYLFQDEMAFVLFPLYGRSRINGFKTQAILWPIVAWGSGDGMKKFRVFPFYGRSEREGKWAKKFVLWPLWTSVRYDYPDKPGGGFILVPFYGHVKAGPDNESWMFIPPLFRYSRSSTQVELNAPWPFFQYASGDSERLYVWPVWGHKKIGPIRSWFCAWPILSGKTVEHDGHTVKRFLLLPFVQHETRSVRPPADPAGSTTAADAPPVIEARSLKVWPLLNYRRQDDRSEFRMLALWPFLNARSMDRNYTPFWTLYSHSSIATQREDKLLWGLFRWRRDDAGNRDVTLFPLFTDRKKCNDESYREWRVLLGLAGYKREGSRKTYRLLYLIRWQTGAEHAEP